MGIFRRTLPIKQSVAVVRPTFYLGGLLSVRPYWLQGVTHIAIPFRAS